MDHRLKIDMDTRDSRTVAAVGRMLVGLAEEPLRSALTSEGLQRTADMAQEVVREAQEVAAPSQVEVGYDEVLVNGMIERAPSITDTLPPPVAPPAPPVPPAPVQSALGPDLDSEGLPWDGRIHSSSKAQIADGSWRLARGVDKNLVETVKAELKQVMALPVPAPQPVAPAAPLAPVAPPQSQDVITPATEGIADVFTPTPEQVVSALTIPVPPVAPVVPAPPVPPVPDAPQNYSGAQSGGYTPTPPVPPVAPVPIPTTEPPVAPAPTPPVAPVEPPAALAPVPPVTPVTPAPAGDAPTTFPAFLQRMTALQNQGVLTMDQVLKVLNSHGIPNPALLNAKRELIPTVYGQLMRVVGGETVETVTGGVA